MLEDAEGAAEQIRIAKQQSELTEQRRLAEIESIIDELVKEFVAAARQLGAKPARPKFGAKRFSPKYWQVYLENKATVWIQSNGVWDFGGVGRDDRSRLWDSNARYLDPANAGLWRERFAAALALRAAGQPENHAKG